MISEGQQHDRHIPPAAARRPARPAQWRQGCMTMDAQDTDAPARGRGRPTVYTQDLADAICNAIATGSSLRAAASAAGMHHSTVMCWARDRPDFANQYARAREIGNEVDFEGLQDLADERPEKTASGAVDPGWVAWQRNRIDVRKWALSKKQPKKYGDKLETTHLGRMTIAREMSDDDLARIASSAE